MVALGRGAGGGPAPPPAADLDLRTVPLSATEIDYPAMRAMHAASSLAPIQQVRDWRGRPPEAPGVEPAGPLTALEPLEEGAGDTIEGTIARRGSSRQFVRQAITFAELSAILQRSTGGVPADFLVAASRTS